MHHLNLTIKRYFLNAALGVLAGGFAYYILGLIPFYPVDFKLFLVLILFLLWALKPTFGVAATFLLFLFPIAYNSITLLFLFIAFIILIAIIDSSSVAPYGFFILTAATICVIQPKLAFLVLLLPVLVGFMGIRRGMIMGAITAFWVQSLACLMGKPNVGLLFTPAGTRPMITLHTWPLTSLLDVSWINAYANVVSLDSRITSALFLPYIKNPMLLIQPALWALCAGTVAFLISRPIIKKVPAYFTAAVAGVLVLGIGYLVIPALFGLAAPKFSLFILSVLVSTVAAAAVSPGLIRVVPLIHPTDSKAKKPAASVKKTWSDLDGMEEVRVFLEEAMTSQFAAKSSTLKQGGKNFPSAGVLLFGPPETGMSDLARLMAHESKATFLSINRNDVFPKYYDVFVSYSTKDKNVADAVVATLEKNNIRCWYAPRDIKPGSDWGKAVADAIKASKLFLLIFSVNSDRSQRVLDEVNYAITNELIVLPFRIENLKPNNALMLHLSTRHWLDAYETSWEEYLNKLKNTVVSNLLAEPEKENTLLSVENWSQEIIPEQEGANDLLVKVFEEACNNRPSVLFVDELEAFLPRQANPTATDSTTKELSNTFLEQMDQLAAARGVLVVGATYHPALIDLASFNPGRFERCVYLKPPDQDARCKLLEQTLWDQPLTLDVDLPKLAGMMERFTRTDIQEVCDEAISQVHQINNSRSNPIKMTDLVAIVKSKRPTFSGELLKEYEQFADQHCQQPSNRSGKEEVPDQ